MKTKHHHKLIAFPTETVYGLGASAFDPDAIAAVFKVKGRPADNPLIVHLASPEMVYDFATDISEDAKLLMAHFWPGPLTLVLKKKPQVLDSITAGLDTVAVRMPDHPVALELLRERGAMVAPSANKSGRPSPTSADHVRADFGDAIPILDGGKCVLGLESTVLRVTEEPYHILRPGHISAQELESVLKKPVIESTKLKSHEPAQSPGMKYSHYAPNAGVRWLAEGEKPSRNDTLYLLLQDYACGGAENVLCYHGDLTLLASQLYDRFRQADIEGFANIVIEKPDFQESGISRALYNRIEKAAGP